ncbi:hypothetical protein MUCCIDRAFT_110267 [Mucor lusitanicus CBS 277.49]|uniref:MIT domain-containing protein n=1 Tax=Mucor lusitanicus CBS 277.49 TaxID=747725 RepID=A0A168LDR3_MUCCL|nr:hypothetical protein MUCCIDRAFT_110267 [Mucor lusitanicus CBS 277.49]
MSFETTSNLLTLNNDPFPTTTATPATTNTTTASDAKHVSKLILRSALQKANAAVQCDSTNDVLGAINAYKEAISLLERVLSTVEKENDRQRLQSIVEEQEQSPTEEAPFQPEKQETPWLAKKSSIRSFSSRQSVNTPSTATASRPSHAMMLRKMTSSSSVEGSIHEKSPPARNHWQDNTPSPSTRPVSQKEMPKFPVSPPIFQMQASKSTPTHPHHRNRSSRQHKQSNYGHGDADDDDEEEDHIDLDSDEFDLDKDEYNLLGPHEPVPARPSHRHNSSLHGSNRSSISSADSVLSSEDSLVEQPAMNLPSLKKKDHDTTPIPKVRSVFRARTSSLPKAPVMQRSSSMSTVDTIASPTEVDQHKHHPPREAMTIDTTPPSHSQTYPAQMIVNRPIISRPSVGGLGSMRKKAANRLSMDGFTISRAKEKLSNSPSAGSNTYGNFLKDHIQPVAADDMEYIMDNSTAVQDDASPHLDSSNEEISLQDSKQSGSSHLKLLLALEKSMLEGAHITQRLYIPKSLWQQPNIRLSSMDIKVSACESLLTDIARLENWSYLDDLISSTRLLDHFETSVDHLQMTLSKKLKRDSIIESSSSSGSSQLSHSGSIHHSSSRDSISMSRMDSGKKTQSFMSWGTKLTKSVERMNAFSLTKTEDQYKNYIEVLQKLFAKIHVLEHWLSHYHAEKQKSRQAQHDVLITKLIKICTVINTVIGGFVVRDITVLLAKWLKRGGSWVNE